MRLQTSSSSTTTATQPMSVNVALCGSIPRSVLLEQQKEQLEPQRCGDAPSSNRLLICKSLGAPSAIATALTSRLQCKDSSLAENNRCGNDDGRPTHKLNGGMVPSFLSSNNLNTAPRESTSLKQRKRKSLAARSTVRTSVNVTAK